MSDNPYETSVAESIPDLTRAAALRRTLGRSVPMLLIRFAIPLVIVFILVALLVDWPLPPNRPVTQDQVDQLNRGMTTDELFQLLGPPSEALDLDELSEHLEVDGGGWRWRNGWREIEVYVIDGSVVYWISDGFE